MRGKKVCNNFGKSLKNNTNALEHIGKKTIFATSATAYSLTIFRLSATRLELGYLPEQKEVTV